MPPKRGSVLEAIVACRNLQGLTGPQKATLLTLATYYGGPDKDIFPSQSTLARDTSLHRVTVVRALDALEEAGLITRHRGWQHKPTVYRLNLRTIRGSGSATPAAPSPENPGMDDPDYEF